MFLPERDRAKMRMMMAENKTMRVIMLHTKRHTNTGKCKRGDTLPALAKINLQINFTAT